MSESKKKMGRPKEKNPKSTKITIRVDNDTVDKIENYCKKNKLSKSELIRKLIEKLQK